MSDDTPAAELRRQLELVRQTMPETLARLELLKRGDIVAEHARMVTPAQLHAYLARTADWVTTELGEWHFVHLPTGARVDTTEADGIEAAICAIAAAEARGQLAVWVDLVRL
ncbi:hypothetical protein [Persicimonas caeni]|uniref:hypothetical protein n=1 Tax=Persicimonas caeni TaxID=2292766 RepID=UPI001FEA8BB6|nr:hypothetical protein [Persicimonas caeni]